MNMLHHLAECIASYICQDESKRKEDYDVYVYGVEVLLISFVNLIAIISTAIIINKVIEAICFISIYTLVRRNAGGYHAKTNLGCIFVFWIIFTFILLVGGNLSSHISTWILSMLGMLFILFVGTVAHPNRPHSKTEAIIFRRRSRLVSILLSLILIILSYVLSDGYREFLVFLSSGQFVASVLAILEWFIQYRKRKTVL